MSSCILLWVPVYWLASSRFFFFFVPGGNSHSQQACGRRPHAIFSIRHIWDCYDSFSPYFTGRPRYIYVTDRYNGSTKRGVRKNWVSEYIALWELSTENTVWIIGSRSLEQRSVQTYKSRYVIAENHLLTQTASYPQRTQTSMMIFIFRHRWPFPWETETD
jgi:hypothetical protein